MISPIAIGLTKEYTLKSDKNDPTIWIIGAIDSVMAAKIASAAGKIEMKDGQPIFVSSGDLADNDFRIVKYALKGFKNFKINGVDVEFKLAKEKFIDREIDVVHNDIIGMIPLFAIHELAMEIWGTNQVTEEEEKN